VLETIEHTTQAGLLPFGAGATRAEALEPVVVRVGKTRVALCGMVAPETLYYDWKASQGSRAQRAGQRAYDMLAARPGRPGAAMASEFNVRSAVAEARSRADWVIVFVHWGIRYHPTPTAFQRRVAHAAIDAGAHLVVGHHAHRWQPVERYRHGAIVYGVGNFAFGSSNRRAREALLVRAVVNRQGPHRLELFPVYTMNVDPGIRYQSKVMRGSSAREMLELLARASAALGTEVTVDRGRGVLSLAQP
jgi:poly-gamma-glutamate synthesis protein (capsule biosynthesis protein)